MTFRPLRPHQERALSALCLSFASGHRRPMLQLPTGAGKTRIAAEIIIGARAKGNAVIFTAPAISLVDQTVAAFEAEGIDCIGVMQGDHPRTDPSMPVQVCSVQTLARREKPGAAIVLADEAHLTFESVYGWMADQYWQSVPFIGLSATPWTHGLGRHYDDLIIPATTGDLIRTGFLCPFVASAPSSPDLMGVRTTAGDYNEEDLAERCNTATLVADIVDTWFRLGEHISTAILRERIFDRSRAGDVRVVCNVATLTVGVNLPMVSCVIDARPTNSEMRFVQTIGRGLHTSGQEQSDRARPRRQSFTARDHSRHPPRSSRRRRAAPSRQPRPRRARGAASPSLRRMQSGNAARRDPL